MKFFTGIFDLDRWQEIWVTITHNRSRSFLTAFGVFWGMFMLVAMVGAGQALQTGVMSQVEGFATNSCFVWSGQTSLPYKGLKKNRYWSIVNEDISVLKEKIPEIQYIAPEISIWGSGNNVSRNNRSGSFGVQGEFPDYNKINASKMLFGRYINDIDITEKRKVCVIGERVYEVLFPTKENPLGKTIQVNGIYFQIIGVAAQKASGVNIGGNAAESVTLPFSTAQQVFNRGNRVGSIAITSKTGVKVKVIEDKIRAVLGQLHSISPDDKTAIGIFNIEDIFTMYLYLSLGIAALIWFVGGGTLIAGGIGISNIMLVTVRERTKEIGIRRALGATPTNIIGQILSESIILTFIAGIAGLMLGVGVLQVVGILLSQGDQFFKDPQISFGIAISSFFILLIIGTLAGFLPANRAMKIKAIDAIREE